MTVCPECGRPIPDSDHDHPAHTADCPRHDCQCPTVCHLCCDCKENPE